MRLWSRENQCWFGDSGTFELEEVHRWLAVVQRRRAADIRRYVGSWMLHSVEFVGSDLDGFVWRAGKWGAWFIGC